MQRWDCKIHVWGYIGAGGVRSIQLIKEGTVTKETYLALMKRTVGRREWRNDRIWQQDNATAHTAGVVAEWLEKNVTRLEDWPPNSPDLSPIENLWGRMWADALKKKPTNIGELWSAVEEVFTSYDDQYIDNLVLSFRRRVMKCVEAKGESIGSEY